MSAGRATPPSPPSWPSTSALKSAAARKIGNDWFQQACVPGLSPALQSLRLEKALGEYVNARRLASLAEHMSSASKNIGSAHARLAVLHTPEESGSPSAGAANRGQKLQRFLEHASGAEISFTRALEERGHGGGVRTTDWRRGVVGQLQTVVAVAKDMLVADHGSLWASDEDLTVVHRFLRSMEDCHVKDDLELKEHIGSYVEQVDMQQSVSESRQAVAEGDRLLAQQLEDQEQPDVDMIWTIIDFYRQGVLLARERCLESEALAHSRLGVMYHKVLKLRGHAKKCFELSLELAESLRPKDLSGEDWHIAAEQGKTSIRRVESVREAEDPAVKEKLKGEIKDLLDPIQAIMDKGVDNVTKMRNLLKHIYAEFPPKLKAHSIGDLKPDKLKVTLTKSIMHYHTDTQQRYRPNAGGKSLDSKGDEIDWGKVGSFEKWELLCGEITRHLNFLYTHTYKSA